MIGYNERWSRIGCFDWCDINGKRILCSSDINTIYEIDLLYGTVSEIGKFPEKPLCSYGLSWSLMRIEDSIFFSPFAANHICEYDLKTQNLSFYKIKEVKKQTKIRYLTTEKFFRMLKYDKFIFFFGRTYPAIIRFDIETKEQIYFDDWVDELDEYLKGRKIENLAFFADGQCVFEERIYVAIACCNRILKINPITLKFEFIDINTDLKGFGGLAYVDGKLWLTSMQQDASSIICYDIKSGFIKEISIPYEGMYLAPVIMNNTISLFPLNDNSIYIYNILTYDWRRVEIPYNICERGNRRKDGRIGVKVTNDSIIICSYSDNIWREFICGQGITREWSYAVEDKDLLHDSWIEKCRLIKHKETKQVIYESDDRLYDFLAALTSPEELKCI